MKFLYLIFLLLFTTLPCFSKDICNIFLNAYPDTLKSCNDNYLVFKNGSKLPFATSGISDFSQLIENAGIKDHLLIKYSKDDSSVLVKNHDPGRIRNEAFFKKMYGDTKKEVENNLVKVKWLPEHFNYNLLVTKINNIDKKMIKISDELSKIINKDNIDYLKPSGSFYWRKINGTNRLSMHSFGIAIDLNARHSNYWRWDMPRLKCRNKIPMEIVHIFEKYGFIWGGRWYHYDTMHFEYRPELLIDIID